MKNCKILKLTACNFGISAINVFLSTYIPLYLTGIGAKPMVISGIISAGFFMGIILQPISGIISDILKRTLHTRKIVFFIFGIIASICIEIIPRLQNKGQVYYAIIVLFAAFHIYQVPLSAMVPDNTAMSEQGKSSAYWSIMGMAGSLTVPFLAAILWGTGKRFVFDILSLTIIISICIPLFYTRERSTAYQETGRSNLKEIILSERGKEIVNFYKIKICWWIAAGFIIPFFPYYMSEMFKASIVCISFTIQSTLIAGIIASLLLIRYKKDIDKFAFLSASLIYIFIYCIICMVSSNICFAVLLMILYGGVLAILTAVPLSMLYQMMPRDRFGEFLGIDNIFLAFPQAMSIGAAGLIYAAAGIRSIFLIGIIFSAVAILLIRKFKRGQ